VSLGVDENRLVRGLISLVSFATPLSAHDRVQAPGFAYWLPPLSPFAFDGPDALVSQVVSTLRRGGLPSVRRAGLEREVIFFTAALLVTVRALERQGWSLNALAEDPVLSARASEQALAVTARRLGERVPLVPRLTTFPALLTLAAPLVPLVVPFDFETYARVHFTKVAAQSRLLLGELVREGRGFSLPVDALEQVLSAVGVTPAT
jgi:2-dehydropantoate 2-reductase